MNKNYKGFEIEREEVGRYGTTFRYKCGRFIAPRRKDIVEHIDRLLDKKLMINAELAQLKSIKF